MALPTKPSVCIVVLNYNGRTLLEQYLASILCNEYPALDLVVVDNGSTDDSVEWLSRNWPQLEVLKIPENRSVSQGLNTGIRHALEFGHDYVLLANNDIQPDPRWVHEAVAVAEEHPQFGVIGYQVFNTGSSRPAYETACSQFAGVTWREADPSSGCALFCNSNIFRAVGLFDETYVCYAEDTDLQYRVKQAGWRCAEINVPVWHVGSATLRRARFRSAFLQMRNVIRLELKLRGTAAGMRAAGHVLNSACNPWLQWGHEEKHWIGRFRPSIWPVNFALALGAMLWNLLALTATLRAGTEARQRINTYLARAHHIPQATARPPSPPSQCCPPP